MTTEYIDLRGIKENMSEALIKAAEVIQRGGLVAFPTETVYGLGANGLDEKAVPRIYEAKGRPSDNPLILHIDDMDMLKKLVKNIPENARLLAEEFWPGPLTMVFEKSEIVPYRTTGGLETVAVRMPSNKTARELIRLSGLPIAAPSANSSGKPSPTKAGHVMEDLSGKIDLVIDGGEVELGLESTIVDVTGEVAVILRPGFITEEMILEVLDEVSADRAVAEISSEKDVRPKAPGMKYKHYAPKGEMAIYKGEPDKVVKRINLKAEENLRFGVKTGVLASEETKECYKADFVISVGSREDGREIARNLFDVLRRFDELGAEMILSESFYDNKLGTAIMNRLHKSAGYNIVNCS